MRGTDATPWHQAFTNEFDIGLTQAIALWPKVAVLAAEKAWRWEWPVIEKKVILLFFIFCKVCMLAATKSLEAPAIGGIKKSATMAFPERQIIFIYGDN